MLAVPPALSSSPNPREFQHSGSTGVTGGVGSPLARAGAVPELWELQGLGLCEDLPCAGLGAGVGGLV